MNQMNEVSGPVNTLAVSGVHPAQREWGVDVFALQPGDIITDEHGNEYRVNPGFNTDQSSCWRDSRYVSCTLLDASRYFPTTYINPIKVRPHLARVVGAA